MHAPGHIHAAIEPHLHLKHLTFNFLWRMIRRHEVIYNVHSPVQPQAYLVHSPLCVLSCHEKCQ